MLKRSRTLDERDYMILLSVPTGKLAGITLLRVSNKRISACDIFPLKDYFGSIVTVK